MEFIIANNFSGDLKLIFPMSENNCEVIRKAIAAKNAARNAAYVGFSGLEDLAVASDFELEVDDMDFYAEVTEHSVYIVWVDYEGEEEFELYPSVFERKNE